MPPEVLIDGVQYFPASREDAPLPDGYISPHFRIAEFDCNHCGKYGDRISPELIDVLEELRRHFGGKAITINSGVRCDFHNANVGGAPNSRHKIEHADAADIVVAGVAPSTVHKYLTDEYPGQYGIGSYAGFTHLDTRPGGAARW